MNLIEIIFEFVENYLWFGRRFAAQMLVWSIAFWTFCTVLYLLAGETHYLKHQFFG